MTPEFRLHHPRHMATFTIIGSTIMVGEALKFAQGMEQNNDYNLQVITDNYNGVIALPQGTHRVTLYGVPALLVAGFGLQVILTAEDPESFSEALNMTDLLGRPEYEQQFHAKVKEVNSENLWVPSKESELKKPSPPESGHSMRVNKALSKRKHDHYHKVKMPSGETEEVCCEINSMLMGMSLTIQMLMEWIEEGTFAGIPLTRPQMIEELRSMRISGQMGNNDEGDHHE